MTERRRSPLRFLAPLALVAFGLALFYIVSSSSVTGPDPSRPAAGAPAAEKDEGSTAADRARRRRAQRRKRDSELPRDVYRVKPGDTLDAIAQTTGRSTEQLIELNPELDPQALGPGQRIKLRE